MEEKKQITNEMVAQALVLLPPTVSYRLGDKVFTYELRIGYEKDQYEANYYCRNVSLYATQSFVYETKGDELTKVIYELYEKVLQHGDLNQDVVNETKCETCEHADGGCVKIYNEDNTTTCIK